MTWTPPAHDAERELRELLPEAAWRAAMAKLCERHDLDAVGLAPFPTGSDVVWGAGDAVVKLTAPLWRAEIAAEVRALRFVEGQLSVEAPRVLAEGELSGWPYLVMSRVSGRALGEVWPSLEPGDRSRLAADLGRLTRELHDLPLDGYEAAREGDELWETADWPRFWNTCRADVGARHGRRGAPAALVAQVEPFLSRLGPLEQEPRVLLHTELLDQHVFLDERAAPCGLIDFADSRLGPATYDFPAPVEFIFRGEPGLLRAFLLGYGLREGELGASLAERLLAWALCHRFGSLARMLKAVDPWRPASLEQLAQRLYGLEAAPSDRLSP